MTDNDSCNYVREVTARYIGPRRKSFSISSSFQAAHFIRRLLKDEAREHFIALFLNNAHQIVSFSLVSIGSANSTVAHPREVFQGAVLVGACAIIIGHNHPSGELVPSEEDKATTKRLKEAGNILGIKILDHVIVSSAKHFSFSDEGLLLSP